MTQLFCIYFDERPIWRSDCIEPIQAGRARTGLKLNMMGDDTGDNISAENLRYGEMTAWYWVWKNYLPKHPELTHIGFCHYRRFLDFTGISTGRKIRTTYRQFKSLFEASYCERVINPVVCDYDVVMRKPEHCKAPTPRDEFVRGHPRNAADWDRFEQVLRARMPASASAIDTALSTPQLAQELQFVMRREVFCSFMEWAFDICRTCEKMAPWGGEDSGARARTPAFLVERFFMVWLAIQRASGTFSVKELAMVKLTGRPWWYRVIKPFLKLVPNTVYRRVYDRFK